MKDEEKTKAQLISELIELRRQISNLPDGETPSELTEHTTDITDRKHMERNMARLDGLHLVGEMAAIISHEIRNPLTTVRGFLQILGGKREMASHLEYFNLMIDELDRANSIIEEYLSLAKSRTFTKKMVSLNGLVEALLPLIRADAGNAGKHVRLDIEDLPDLLMDENEIRQLIFNFVRNGLEAMLPDGTLTIRTFMENGEIVLAIMDEGAGIEPGLLEKIGTPFFTTKEKGTGLGLAVCYNIAQRHRATISVDTGAGGTTFSVRFSLDN